VLSVELVGEIIEPDVVEPAPATVLDAIPDVIVVEEDDVCAVDDDALVEAFVDVLLSTAEVLEVLSVSASVSPGAASEVVAGGDGDGVESTVGVVVEKCVARKDDMAAGVLLKDASNPVKVVGLLNELAIVCLFRPSRPFPRSLPVQTRDPGLRLFQCQHRP
jgi:hypothetical protein